MGDYYFKRNNLYKRLMNIYQIDLDNFSIQNMSKINKILNKRIKNYDEYIKSEIINEPNISLFVQIRHILLKDFFNLKNI